MQGFFGQPAALVLAPLALAILYLLERWRQRPTVVVVADLTLFETTPEVEAQVAARRRRLGVQWLLRAAAALLLALAVADTRSPIERAGDLQLDLVLDRGLSSGTHEGSARRLDAHRANLAGVLDLLRPTDRVRLHLSPASGPAASLSPDDARAALAACSPTAAEGNPEGLALRLAARSTAPVFVATDRRISAAGLAVANAGTPQPNRGIVALARGTDGALHATVASTGAPGPVDVVVSAQAGERVVTRTVRVELPLHGRARATVRGLPAEITEASARLEPGDALPTDDRAFAVLAPATLRRIGCVGDPGPDVLRALRAVPGAEVEHLDALPPPRAQALFDLLVVSRLPEEPAATALLALPSSAGDIDGGALVAGGARAVFPFTAAALAREPQARAAGLRPLPQGLGSFETLLSAGSAPFLLVSGRGRSLVAVAAGPLRSSSTNWPLQASFPVFFAELLQEVSPRAAARLEAHTAGRRWRGLPPLPEPPLWVTRVRAANGQLLLGTVAAPLAARDLPPPAGFSADALAGIDAARPRGQPTSLVPLLAILGLLLAFGSWRLQGRG